MPSVERAQFIRLMIAHNVLLTVHRAMFDNLDNAPGQHGEYVDRGDRMVFFMIAVGALKEAIDAFKVTPQEWYPSRLSRLKSQYEMLWEAKDKESSDYKMLDRIRSRAGFHWSQSELQSWGDGKLAVGRRVEIAVASDDGSLQGYRFTVADEALTETAFGTADLKLIRQRMIRIRELVVAMLHVLEDAAEYNLKRFGAIGEPLKF